MLNSIFQHVLSYLFCKLAFEFKAEYVLIFRDCSLLFCNVSLCLLAIEMAESTCKTRTILEGESDEEKSEHVSRDTTPFGIIGRQWQEEHNGFQEA